MPDPTKNTAEELIASLPDESQYMIERFLHSLGSQTSSNTTRQYRRVTAQYLTFLNTENVLYGQSSPHHIEDFFFELGELSANTEKNYLSIITSFYDYMILHDLCKSNPASTYRKSAKKRFRKAPDPQRNAIREEQFNAIVSARRNLDKLHEVPSPVMERNIAILHLFYGTGLRRQELCGLNVASYDEKDGTLRVLGKGSKERRVAILHQTEEVLRGYILETRPLFNPAEIENAMFLSKSDNEPASRMSYDQISYMVRKSIETSGLFPSGDHGTHLLRRSHATLIQRQTGNPKLVQAQLGHASITTTDIYIRLSDTEQTTEIRDKVGYVSSSDTDD